jgi:hypothetical protein
MRALECLRPCGRFSFLRATMYVFVVVRSRTPGVGVDVGLANNVGANARLCSLQARRGPR